jgi:hypothetical protein
MRKFVVIGAKWFDRVNGNTYNSAKIIDTETGEVHYTRFCYGYGSAYLQEARHYIRENITESFEIIDGGSFYTKKSDAKNGNF